MKNPVFTGIRLSLRVCALLVLAAICAAAPINAVRADSTGSGSSVATPLPENVLYDGQTLAGAPFTASSWGAGEVNVVDYTGLSGTGKALKVDSYGPYEGALFTFNPPGVLGDAGQKLTRYLVITVATDAPPAAPTDQTTRNPTLQLAGSAGPARVWLAQGRPYNPAMPGQRPGMPPNMNPRQPQPNGNGTTNETTPAVKPIQSLHLILHMTDGTVIDTMRALPPQDPSTPWMKLGIPIGHLPIAPGSSLASVMIASDKTGTFYIASMKLVTDTTPISGYIEGSRDVDPNEEQTYTAQAVAGASNLTYTWKFDDDNSMPTGMTVKHTFATAGAYKVSVTVLDADGIKPGIRTTTTVHVTAP